MGILPNLTCTTYIVLRRLCSHVPVHTYIHISNGERGEEYSTTVQTTNRDLWMDSCSEWRRIFNDGTDDDRGLWIGACSGLFDRSVAL